MTGWPANSVFNCPTWSGRSTANCFAPYAVPPAPIRASSVLRSAAVELGPTDWRTASGPTPFATAPIVRGTSEVDATLAPLPRDRSAPRQKPKSRASFTCCEGPNGRNLCSGRSNPSFLKADTRAAALRMSKVSAAVLPPRARITGICCSPFPSSRPTPAGRSERATPVIRSSGAGGSFDVGLSRPSKACGCGASATAVFSSGIPHAARIRSRPSASPFISTRPPSAPGRSAGAAR